MYITSENEEELLKTFLKGSYNLCTIKVYTKNNIEIFKFIYQIISENKRAFLSFVIATNSNISHNRMKIRLSNAKLEEKINLIMERLKETS